MKKNIFSKAWRVPLERIKKNSRTTGYSIDGEGNNAS